MQILAFGEADKCKQPTLTVGLLGVAAPGRSMRGLAAEWSELVDVLHQYFSRPAAGGSLLVKVDRHTFHG